MSFNTAKFPVQVFPEQFTLNFYLRDNQSAKPTDIVYVIRWLGYRLNLTRGVKVIPYQWSRKEQRAIISYKFPEINNVANRCANQMLEEDLATFEYIVCHVCLNPAEILNFESLISEKFMAKKPRKAKDVVKIDIFKIIESAVINNSTINKSTQDNYLNKGLKALRAFSEYRKTHNEAPIDSFERLNSDMIDAFVDYLKSGKYLQPTGQSYAMSSLNSIIKYAVAAIKCTPSSYLPKSQAQLITAPQLKDKTSDNNEIALNNKEVTLLWNYQPTDKEDQKILDMFLLECTTGQRISDIPKIMDGIQNRDGILYINIVQEKTSKKVQVPIIFEIAKDILEKYTACFPKVDKDKINKNIKRIAKDAGICGMETISRHYSGSDKPIVTKHDRADLISSHTGRRTFVSLLSTRGWNYEEIAKYTGHTNIRTVQKYDKSSAIDREAFKKMKPEDKVLLLSEVKSSIERYESFGHSEESKAPTRHDLKTGVEVLLRAAKQLGYEFGKSKGGRESLIDLSRFLHKQKETIIASDGQEEYCKIRQALQYGTTIQEQELLNKFFAMSGLTWKGRPLQFTHFAEAQSFWKKLERKDRLETE